MEHVVRLYKFIEWWNIQLGFINVLSGGTCS